MTQQFMSIDSSAVDAIVVNDDTVSITYKSSGKSYNYALNGISTQDFVNTVHNVIENNQSVGRFINKSIREDQTLQIVAV
jgi:hypothetical protein